GLLTLVGLCSIFILMDYVVPKFAAIFSDPRMKIPTPTLLLIQTSAYVKAYSLPAFAVLVVVIIAFQMYVRTAAGALWWDSLRLKVPLLGDALRKAETARFARAMSTLIAASV